MFKSFFLAVVTVIIFAASVSFSATDLKDTPYFSGMAEYKIVEAIDQDFSDYRFYNGKDCITVEGAKYYRAYSLKENGKQASELQIARNYSNALNNMGGEILFDGICSGSDCAENCGSRMMVGKIAKEGSEIWLEVVPFNEGYDYYLTLIVKKVMKQEVTAAGMLNVLNKEGHLALYINFDSGKSTIKQESKPIIDQIVQMMKGNTNLKIKIEGHTDNTGDPKFNKTLSEERAKSVVSAIVAQGIDSNRLTWAGYGQEKPIADNKTEEGRAKNRRVELVKN